MASLSNNNLLLIDFVLRDIHFSEEYALAVEQKQIAEQQAQQARLTVEQKKQEAEQARQVAQGQADAAVIAAQETAEAQIIQAEAQARANELIGQSLQQNPEILQYQYILKPSSRRPNDIHSQRQPVHFAIAEYKHNKHSSHYDPDRADNDSVTTAHITK